MAVTFQKKYGPWAIVAGGAEGLGKSYSEALAKRGMNLILVDHQFECLRDLAEDLEQKYGIRVLQFHIDLGLPEAAENILQKMKDLDVRLLIYNAAYSLIKPFINHHTSELDTFIEVNARTQIQLVHAFSKRLIAERKNGGIIMMSSLAGLIGMQLVAPYAATKAFAWNLAESIHYELKPYNIDVMACIAGATSTPAYLKTKPKYGFFKPAVMDPADVTESALKQLGIKTLFIPGFSNRFNYFILIRLLPRKWAASMANVTMGKMYQSNILKP